MGKNCSTKNKSLVEASLSRRSFLKSSTVATTSMILVPTVFGMLLNEGQSYAANDASIATASFVSQGGFNWFAEFVSRNKAGQSITTYNTQGINGPNLSTNVDNTSLNVPMWSNGAFATAWRAMQANAAFPQALRDKLKNVMVEIKYGVTDDDTQVDMRATVNAEAHLNSLLPNNSRPIKGLLINGLNGATPYRAVPKFNPTPINNLNAYQELFNPLSGALATNNVTSKTLEMATKFAARLSDVRARELMGQTVQGAADLMNNSKAASTEVAERFASPPTVPNPLTDADINRFVPFLSTQTTLAPNDVLAAGLQGLKDKKTTALYVNMSPTVRDANNTQVATPGGGFDYHGQNVLGQPSWQLLHKKVFTEYLIPTMLVLANADIPFQVTVLHDGAAAFNPDGYNQPPAGDSDIRTMHVTFHWQPGGKVDLKRSQLGGYTNSEAVDLTAWAGANNPDIIGAARLATLADRLRLNNDQIGQVMDPALMQFSLMRIG